MSMLQLVAEGPHLWAACRIESVVAEFEGNGIGGRWCALEVVPGRPAAEPTTLLEAT